MLFLSHYEDIERGIEERVQIILYFAVWISFEIQTAFL